VAGITFTKAELGRLWVENGGKVVEADTAAAIALAYSGGCRFTKSGPVDDRPIKTCTYTFTRGVNRYGLWGINPAHHPRFSPAELYTALGNVRAAIEAVGINSDFSAFPEYNSGEFEQHTTPGITSVPPIKVTPQPGRTVPPKPRPAPVGGNVLTAWGGFARQLAHGLPAHLTSSRNYRAALAVQIRRMGGT
jgi:hypothetical protein